VGHGGFGISVDGESKPGARELFERTLGIYYPEDIFCFVFFEAYLRG